MSSSLCLGMPTCFEPLLMQPRVLGLALFPHVQPSSPSPATTRSPPLSEQIPSSLSYGEVAVHPLTCPDDNGMYVHPLIKHSFSFLSEKSLEMCTESLGSETGTGDFLGDEDESEMYPFFVTEQCSEFPELKSSKKGDLGSSRDFPPPLKSMAGSLVVRMRPCRGDGRLVLQAVSMSSCCNSFLVERGGGRLRLSLYHEEDATECYGEEERAGEGLEDQDKAEEEEEEEIGKEEERIGGGRGRRPCRCKEGEGLLNWKPCWVAT